MYVKLVYKVCVSGKHISHDQKKNRKNKNGGIKNGFYNTKRVRRVETI